MTDSPRSADRLTGHLPTLDGWRGVAVLMVIVFHAIGWQHPTYKPLGGLGVSLFFALSGFLICSRLLAEFSRTEQIDLRGFYIRRVLRILPPALVLLAALAVLGAATPGELTACVLFARNYYNGGGWYTGHFWSLAVEEHFYLFFPVLLAWASPRRAIPWVIGLVALLIAWRTFDDHWLRLSDRVHAASQYFRTDCRLPDLLFGAITALVAGRAPLRLVRVAGAAGGIVLLARVFDVRVPWLAQTILLPWLLLGTVLHADGWAGRALEWRPLAWLGRMSYSLYLWQQLFFIGPSPTGLAAMGPLQLWPWNVLGLLVCATASHYLLERPLTRFGRALADRRRTTAPIEPRVEAYRFMFGRSFGFARRAAQPARRESASTPDARS
jgi:peptidoglycan/LPS O-acetylase OafA/YrhL